MVDLSISCCFAQERYRGHERLKKTERQRWKDLGGGTILLRNFWLTFSPDTKRFARSSDELDTPDASTKIRQVYRVLYREFDRCQVVSLPDASGSNEVRSVAGARQSERSQLCADASECEWGLIRTSESRPSWLLLWPMKQLEL
jgi:hypothetical protein